MCAPAVCVRCEYDFLQYVYAPALCVYVPFHYVCLCVYPCTVCVPLHYVGIYLYAPVLCVYPALCMCPCTVCRLQHCGW